MTDPANPYQSPSEETPPPEPSPEKSWGWPMVMLVVLSAAGVSLALAPGLFIALVILAIPVILRTQWLVQRRLNEGEGPDFWTMCVWLARSVGIVMTIAFSAGTAFVAACRLSGAFISVGPRTVVMPFVMGAIAGGIVTVLVTRETWEGRKLRDVRSMRLARHHAPDEDGDE